MNFRFGLANIVSGGVLSTLLESARASEAGLHHLQNELGQFQAAQRAAGWNATGEKVLGFSRADIRDVAAQALRLYWENAIIHRGVSIQTHYVFAQGFTLSSPDESVQTVITNFVTDIRNRNVITEPEAAARRDVELQCDGNLFIGAYTDKTKGDVSVRVLDAATFEDVIRNPDDSEDPWFYHRVFQTEELDFTSGEIRTVTKTVYHPDVNYRPIDKPSTIGGHDVLWDAPVFHFKPGALTNMKFGLCEFYSAQAPAKSYITFLGHRMKVAEALSRFCMKFINRGVDGAKAALDTASALAQRLRDGRSRGGNKAGDEENVGHAAILGEGGDVEAVNVKGATINPDEGRRQGLVAYAGFGFPETFWGDASVGSLATAQSLDRPTEFKIELRRRFWADVLHSLVLYAIMQAARAADNEFQANIEYRGNTPQATLPSGEPVVIEVAFPDVLEHDITETVNAIDKASGHLPDPELNAELMMNALKVKNAPERLKKMKFPDPAKPEPAPKTDPSKPEHKDAKTK